MSETCPDCDNRMDLIDSHYEYVTAIERVGIKYYECPSCGNEITIEVDA